MEIDLETTATAAPNGGWLDVDGFAGPFRPGDGPRRDPKGEFPTGPPVGARLPEIVAPRQDGSIVDVHRDRGGQPAIVVFFRSAVW